jgi:hypothetical protein
MESLCRPAPAWRNVDGAGHPRAIFHRAIEHGNLAVAEATLRAEIPRPTLVDLLDLTALIDFKQPERYSRVAACWLLRYLQVVEDATIHDAAHIAACLQALGGSQHKHALAALRHMTETADRRRLRRGVAPLANPDRAH